MEGICARDLVHAISRCEQLSVHERCRLEKERDMLDKWRGCCLRCLYGLTPARFKAMRETGLTTSTLKPLRPLASNVESDMRSTALRLAPSSLHACKLRGEMGSTALDPFQALVFHSFKLLRLIRVSGGCD